MCLQSTLEESCCVFDFYVLMGYGVQIITGNPNCFLQGVEFISDTPQVFQVKVLVLMR
jgi:hypothetical protein